MVALLPFVLCVSVCARALAMYMRTLYFRLFSAWHDLIWSQPDQVNIWPQQVLQIISEAHCISQKKVMLILKWIHFIGSPCCWVLFIGSPCCTHVSYLCKEFFGTASTLYIQQCIVGIFDVAMTKCTQAKLHHSSIIQYLEQKVWGIKKLHTLFDIPRYYVFQKFKIQMFFTLYRCFCMLPIQIQ